MRKRNLQLTMLIGLCACLILSGCYQGYGQDVNSEAELDSLLQSLTPGNNVAQPTTAPLQQSSPQPTSVPTLPSASDTPESAATNQPIVAEGGTIIHIVAPGETLFNIAQQYNVQVEMLSALNGITDPNSVFVEQALIIPPTNIPAEPTQESTETSNLPTASATPLPTLTYTPTYTVTPSFTPTQTATSTDIPTLTWTPSATAVTLATVTAEPTDEPQLSADVQAVHRVETGQTLFQISQEYSIPLETLAEVNGIDDASQVSIGQEILIPAGDADEAVLMIPTETPASEEVALAVPTETATLDEAVLTVPTESPATESSDPTIHVVSAGETLYQISLNYSVSLEALAQTNNIADTNQVVVGQELQIPLATPSSVVQGETTVDNTDPAPQRIALNIPTQVNGVSVNQIVQMSPQAEATILEIYARGQAMGRNPRAFSKLGDSTIENPHFLTRFDNWKGFDYNLGEYAYLQGVIDYYAGSFIRQGAAVRRGMHSWTVFDTQWADKAQCQPAEPPLTCEFRIHNPSILLIRLGANDVGVPQAFENNMRDVVEFSIENGVIPILGTKADRNDGASNPNNQIIRRLAEEYQLPLWDFDSLANTLPRRGLTTDGIHMTINFSHDYTDPATFRTGHGANNLSALILLDVLWQTLNPDVG